jgi:molybdopterin converting factor small subunit
MEITVKLYATLRKFRPEVASGEGFALQVPAGASVEQVAAHLAIPEGVAWVAMVNAQVVPSDRVVQAGDSVSFFPPVAGG